jgi:multimeric flavodoxin WrbA
MKILAIMGSPHKGNSYTITTQIEAKMKTMGEVEFDYLFLKDVYLELCRGCFTCFAKGEEHCPIQDDRAQIEARMFQADGVIFVSPVYAINVTALFKNFVDRLAYIFHRPRFFGKYALVVSTTGGAGLKEVLRYLAIPATGWGFQLVHKLGVISPPKPMALTEKFQHKNQRKIEKAARLFYNAIAAKTLPSPSLGDLIGFRGFRTVITLGKDQAVRDYAYWTDETGWVAQNYFYDVRINPVKNMVAALMERLIRSYIPKIYHF